MKPLDKVIFYTHEGNDLVHNTIDQVAFVLGVVDEKTIDYVAFPRGGPTVYGRAVMFDPDNPGDAPGLSYWRPDGAAPPDFAKAFAWSNEPSWQALRTTQRAELTAAEANKALVAADIKSVKDRQKTERDALATKLAADKAKVAKPVKPEEPKQTEADRLKAEEAAKAVALAKTRAEQAERDRAAALGRRPV